MIAEGEQGNAFPIHSSGGPQRQKPSDLSLRLLPAGRIFKKERGEGRERTLFPALGPKLGA